MDSGANRGGRSSDEIAAALETLRTTRVIGNADGSAGVAGPGPGEQGGRETAPGGDLPALESALDILEPWLIDLYERDPFVARFAACLGGLHEKEAALGRLVSSAKGEIPPQLARIRERTEELCRRIELERADLRQTALRAVDTFRDAAVFLDEADRVLDEARNARSFRDPSAPSPALHTLRRLGSSLEILQRRWNSSARARVETVLLRLEQHPLLRRVLEADPALEELPREAKRAGERFPAELGHARVQLREIVRSAEELLESARALMAARDYRGAIRFLAPHRGHPEMVSDLVALYDAAERELVRGRWPIRIVRAAALGFLIVVLATGGLMIGAMARSRLEARRLFREALRLADQGRVIDAYGTALPLLSLHPPSPYEDDLVRRLHGAAIDKVESLWRDAGPLTAARWTRTWMRAATQMPRRAEVLALLQRKIVDSIAGRAADRPEEAAALLQTAFPDRTDNPLAEEALARFQKRAIARVESLLDAGDLPGASGFLDRLTAALPGGEALPVLDAARAWCARHLVERVSQGDLENARIMAAILFRPEGGARYRTRHIEEASRRAREEIARRVAGEGVASAKRFYDDLAGITRGAVAAAARKELISATLDAIEESVFREDSTADRSRGIAEALQDLEIPPERIRAELHEPLASAIRVQLERNDFERACDLFARAAPLVRGQELERLLAGELRSWAAEHPSQAMEILSRHPGSSVLFPAAEAAVGTRLALWLIGEPGETCWDLPREPRWIGFGGNDDYVVAALPEEIFVYGIDMGGTHYVLETGESLAQAALGEFLVIASPSQWRVYRLRDGARLQTLDVDISLPGKLRQLQLYDTAVSRRGQFLLTSYSRLDGLVRVYDPVLRKEIVVMQDFDEPGTPVFSPDGGKLAVPREKEVTVALLGGWRDRLSLPFEERPAKVAFDSAGRRLAVALKRSIEVYDVGNPYVPNENTASRLLFRLDPDGIPWLSGTETVSDVLFDPSGRILVVVWDEAVVAVWDSIGWRLLRHLRPETRPVRQPTIAAEDAALAYASEKRLVVVRWRMPEEEPVP